MSIRTVKLTIITDFVCSSCYVGYVELLDAIRHCQQDLNLPLDFNIEHMPFRLISPSILPEGTSMKREDFLRKHVGSERCSKMKTTLSTWCEQRGIKINFNGVISQSTRAHRLCIKAYRLGGQSRQIPLMHAIFSKALQEGKDIGDIEELANMAEASKAMTRQEAIDFLNSDELVKEVDSMCCEARAKGITGVPVTVIDGKWAVNGGQCSDVFVQIFKKLANPGAYSAPSTPFASGMVDTVVACPGTH